MENNQSKLEFFKEDDIQQLIDYILKKYDPTMPLVLWIDLFCGCGGVTEGYSRNENNFIVGCVNHDKYAIISHHANHPKCIHYTEDIRDWTVIKKIESLIIQLRKVFPNAIIGLHASLECTHFSKAKGGLARDADSRTLANHLYKYFCIKPDYITIENVEEFLTWGPVDEKGKPIPELKCIDYNKWVEEFKNNGFNYNYKILNAADFGAFTSRKRYFGVFAANNYPIQFPEPTHVSKKKHHLFPELLLHNPVHKKLNLLNEGVSLFGLNKNGVLYTEATFWRVYYGLLKFYKEGYFTIRYNGGNPANKSNSLTKPLGTILTNNTHSLIKPIFLTSYYGQSKNGQGVYSLEEPCRTIATKDTFALHHIQYAYGKPVYSKLEEPLNTLTSIPKAELVSTKWIYDNQFGRIGCSINKPCPTIIARQDKKPLYLASTTNISTIDQSIHQPEDNEVKIHLRIFMRENGITDIKIRSLELDELKRIQGFPNDYILCGGKTRAMKYIGNSVCPEQSEALGKSIYKGIINYDKEKKVV